MGIEHPFTKIHLKHSMFSRFEMNKDDDNVSVCGFGGDDNDLQSEKFEIVINNYIVFNISN